MSGDHFRNDLDSVVVDVMTRLEEARHEGHVAARHVQHLHEGQAELFLDVVVDRVQHGDHVLALLFITGRRRMILSTSPDAVVGDMTKRSLAFGTRLE